MTLIEILAIIIIHWIADFIFQDEKWALGKNKNWKDLLSHTITYSVIWILPIDIIFGVFNQKENTDWYLVHTEIFVSITFICHTVTDYFTSKTVSKKFVNKQYGSPIPNFGAFTIIGFDQVLHYIQLFTTYYLLK